MNGMNKYDGKHKDKIKDEIFAFIVGGMLALVPVSLALIPVFLILTNG